MVIGFAHEACRHKAEEAGVEISTEMPLKLVVRLDASRTERAVTNLLTNAIEASDKGQSITIILAKEGKNAAMNIVDKGKGMDRETVEHIFTPFYSTKSKGTGLGMGIAKKIIEEHGGTFRIRSEPGSGTTVTVILPFEPSPPREKHEDHRCAINSLFIFSPPRLNAETGREWYGKEMLQILYFNMIVVVHLNL